MASWYHSDLAEQVWADFQSGMSYSKLGKKYGMKRDRVWGFIKWKLQGQDGAKTLGVKDQVAYDREIERLRAEKGNLQKKYKQALYLANVQDAICGVMRDHVEAMPAVKIPELGEIESGTLVENALLLVGDTHAGEEISFAETGGINEYGWHIFECRMSHTFERSIYITHYCLSNYVFPKIYIELLGDMIPGWIHQDTARAARDSLLQWVCGAASVIAQGIGMLARYFPEIEVTCVVGNHGRFEKKPYYKQRYCNWDYVCYILISLLLANQRNVHFNIPRAFWYYKQIGDKGYLSLHGDDIRSWMRIPWYGITEAVHQFRSFLTKQGKFLHHTFMGHFHDTGELDDIAGTVYINGSVSGPSEFSIGKRLGAPPKQTLMGLHDHRGPTGIWPITLEDAPQPDSPVLRYDMGQGAEQLVEVARAMGGI